MGAALAALLLTACAKPVDKTAADATATTATAADTAAMNTVDAAGGAAAPGGAVSPPQSNDAINADANKMGATQAAGSNSFTEGQARGHIENAGYSNVTGLTKTPDGMWMGRAVKGGKTMDVSVDFKGAVTSK